MGIQVIRKPIVGDNLKEGDRSGFEIAYYPIWRKSGGFTKFYGCASRFSAKKSPTKHLNLDPIQVTGNNRNNVYLMLAFVLIPKGPYFASHWDLGRIRLLMLTWPRGSFLCSSTSHVTMYSKNYNSIYRPGQMRILV